MAAYTSIASSLSPLWCLTLLMGVGLSACSPDDSREDPAIETTGPTSPLQGAPVPSLEFDARFPIGFSFLNGVRELGDGSVLAADPLAQVLLRIDSNLALADTLGRPGPGPQEYRQPDQILPLPGDSSLLVDLGKAQLTQVLPDGSFGSGMSMLLPSEEGLGDVLHPQFTDAEGNLYDVAARSRDMGPPDSASIIRYRRDAASTDTVGWVWLPERESRRTRRRGFLPKLLQERDEWAVAPDGRLAIARAHGATVEWIGPDGIRSSGPSHSFTTYQVRDADKEAILEAFRSEAISMTAAANRSGSVTRMTMSRGLPDAGDAPGIGEYEWADAFPIFRPDRASVSDAGELWLERWLPVDHQSQWEVFDEEGRWLGSVNLPTGYRLLGFGHTTDGQEAAYLTALDEFGLKWLERYRVVR